MDHPTISGRRRLLLSGRFLLFAMPLPASAQDGYVCVKSCLYTRACTKRENEACRGDCANRLVSGGVLEQGRLVSILEGGYHVPSQPARVTRSGHAHSRSPRSGALASSTILPGVLSACVLLRALSCVHFGACKRAGAARVARRNAQHCPVSQPRGTLFARALSTHPRLHSLRPVT